MNQDDMPIDVAKPDSTMELYDWFLVALFVVLMAYIVADYFFDLGWI